jgi:hypothetical protein
MLALTWPTPINAADSVKMTDERARRLMGRLLDSETPGMIPAQVAKFFKLGDGTAKLPVRMVKTTDAPDDFIGIVHAKPDPNNFFVARREPDRSVHFFLTDLTWRLRAAASSAKGQIIPFRNEDVAAEFQECVDHLAEAADGLPETDPAK